MSNANALATVTAVLVSTLVEVTNAALTGTRVFVGRPERRADQPRTQTAVNIFLYQVAVNPNWRNADAPTRDSKGRLVQRPAIGLDLNYMLTFYGPGFLPQILLGHTVSRLHARPLLTRVNIKAALSQTESIPGDAILRETDLDQFELIRLSPVHFTLDEMSRLWSVFFQTPYDLSIAYQASVVLVEAMDEVPQPALPVLDVGPRMAAYAIPQIEQVVPQMVHPGTSEITLKGRHLAVAGSTVRFGGLATPASTVISGPDLTVALPPGLAAGIIPVSVDVGGGLVSNAAALVYRPLVSAASFRTRHRQVVLDVQPPMQPQQRGLVLLNQRLDRVTSPEPRKAYTLPVAPPAAASGTIVADAAAVLPGTYLVRVQIDGAESALVPPPDGSTDEAFAGPTVTIS